MKVVKIFKFILKAIKALVILLLLYGFCVFAICKIPVNKQKRETVNSTIPVYVLSNGVHTDIVLPVKNQLYDWSQKVKFENTIAKDTTVQYIAFGWGDKGFYLETPTWDDLKFSTALKAATGMSTSAMHVTFYKKMRQNRHCKRIMITENDYKNLIAYVEDSFKLKGGSVEKIETNAVYGKNDAFFEAKGSYSLFHTCNTWANNALKAANQKAALWTATDTGILDHYKK